MLLLAFALAMQTAAPAPQAAVPAPGVIFWQGGMPPDGPKGKAPFAGGSLSITVHDGSGVAEMHETVATVMVIQRGEGTLVYGGEVVSPTRSGPHDVRGPSIRNGTERHVAPGDVVYFPAGMPHQWLVPAGKQLTYLVVHIEQPAP